jgi:hypothetical protein
LLTGHFTGEYLISYSPDVRNTQSGDTDCCWWPWRFTKRKIASAPNI